MRVEQLTVPDAYVLTPQAFTDDRGAFFEWYRHEALIEAIGYPLELAQANCSVSRRGVLRGVHYADVPPGQAKFVTCVRGAVLDVVVDLRVGSATFGHWEAVRLDPIKRRAVYVSEGLGHAFCALDDDATVAYLCNEVYNPLSERGIDPLDPQLAIDWPSKVAVHLSEKDAAAPSLEKALDGGELPTIEDCRRVYARRRNGYERRTALFGGVGSTPPSSQPR